MWLLQRVLFPSSAHINLRVRGFLGFLDPSGSPNLVASHAVSSAERFSALLPTNSDFLCSSPQCPAYHFYKLLIPSSDLLYFPLLFLHHIRHHVPYVAFISPFKNLVLSLPSLPPPSPLPGAGLVCRYTAVVKPVQYQYSTGQSSCRRVSLMIVVVWMLAFAVSCPLLFGFNTTGRWYPEQ